MSIELCRIANDDGSLTEDGIFMVKLILQCTFINGETLWDRILRNPDEKAELAKKLGEELKPTHKEEVCPICGSTESKPSPYAYTRAECTKCGHHFLEWDKPVYEKQIKKEP